MHTRCAAVDRTGSSRSPGLFWWCSMLEDRLATPTSADSTEHLWTPPRPSRDNTRVRQAISRRPWHHTASRGHSVLFPCAHVARCVCFPPAGVTTPPLEIAAEKKSSQIVDCGAAGSPSPSPPSLQGPTPSARLCRCAESGRQNVSSTLPTCSRPVSPDALRYRVIPVQPCSRVSNIKACPAAGPRCASCLRTSITARVSTHTSVTRPSLFGPRSDKLTWGSRPESAQSPLV